MDFKSSSDRIWLEDETGETVAFIEFPEFEEGKVEVTHTVVDPRLQGQGIASNITKAMAEQLRAENKKAELTCSYAVSWFNKHRDYEDVLIDKDAEYKKAETMFGAACGLPRHRKKSN
ncbi:MAG: N-acetyltransferase [Lachnospiraceae bacterium]|nr:N-acetyltransferase [Lachnospiraceae bacterium]